MHLAQVVAFSTFFYLTDRERCCCLVGPEKRYNTMIATHVYAVVASFGKDKKTVLPLSVKENISDSPPAFSEGGLDGIRARLASARSYFLRPLRPAGRVEFLAALMLALVFPLSIFLTTTTVTYSSIHGGLIHTKDHDLGMEQQHWPIPKNLRTFRRPPREVQPFQHSHVGGRQIDGLLHPYNLFGKILSLPYHRSLTPASDSNSELSLQETMANSMENDSDNLDLSVFPMEASEIETSADTDDLVLEREILSGKEDATLGSQKLASREFELPMRVRASSQDEASDLFEDQLSPDGKNSASPFGHKLEAYPVARVVYNILRKTHSKSLLLAPCRGQDASWVRPLVQVLEMDIPMFEFHCVADTIEHIDAARKARVAGDKEADGAYVLAEFWRKSVKLPRADVVVSFGGIEGVSSGRMQIFLTGVAEKTGCQNALLGHWPHVPRDDPARADWVASLRKHKLSASMLHNFQHPPFMFPPPKRAFEGLDPSLPQKEMLWYRSENLQNRFW